MDNLASLRRVLAATHPTEAGDDDFAIVADIGPGLLAVSKAGTPALLVPIEFLGNHVARRGGGFLLRPVPQVAFRYQGRSWQRPAAVLECTQADLRDTFLSLAIDLARRFAGLGTLDWTKLLGWLNEWESLFAEGRGLSWEEQLGLWGEVSLLCKAARPEHLIKSWRGPDKDRVDFFAGGVALEVKTSRAEHVHHISHKQVDRPVGEGQACLLSIWVAVDHDRGTSLKHLVNELLARVEDPAGLLRKLALVGYAPSESTQYDTPIVFLEEPSWFWMSDVPRVRAHDEGVSNIRYVVTLDREKAMSREHAAELRRHFLGSEAALFPLEGL